MGPGRKEGNRWRCEKKTLTSGLGLEGGVDRMREAGI